jgi:hypothetical protein
LTSPSGAGLLWLLISSVTIKVVTYLFSRELEVDLSRSDVDDCIGSVENGLPRMMGESSSSSMYKIVKLAGA